LEAGAIPRKTAWYRSKVPAEDAAEERVCAKAKDFTVGEDGRIENPEIGRGVSILDVSTVMFSRVRATGCSGWGVTVPLYSVRYNDSHDVKGPIAAGLGGGYYAAVSCRKTATFGLEAFVYSEGLDPGKLFHLGVAAGPQLVVFDIFSIGIAFGYDVYRDVAGVPAADMTAAVPRRRTGLLTASLDKENWSALITFSVTQSSDSKSTPKKE